MGAPAVPEVAAKVEIGTYGYDDPGSDYGFGSKMHLDFGLCRDQFTDRERVAFQGRPGQVGPNYRAPGWYFFQPDDDNMPTIEVHKSDLVSLEAAQ